MTAVFHVIIPARYGSTRLPGKPLLDIAEKPMILHVVAAAQASGARSVTVATDDHRIATVVRAAGGDAILTALDHASGSDRIAETCAILELPPEAVVVNVQGDEPEMPAALIHQVAELLVSHDDSVMATLCAPISSVHEFVDPSVVKVVRGQNNRALYFSRAPLPWNRSDPSARWEEGAWQHAFRHVGIYAYRVGDLLRFTQHGPCTLERQESLEQLRVLWHGEPIVCGEACVSTPPGVDTPADLDSVRQRWGRSPGTEGRE